MVSLASGADIRSEEGEIFMTNTVTVRKIINDNGRPRYVDAFTIKDGTQIDYGTGPKTVKAYGDGYHIYVDSLLFHVDQFAEILMSQGLVPEPVNADDVRMKYFQIELRDAKDYNDTKFCYVRGSICSNTL